MMLLSSLHNIDVTPDPQPLVAVSRSQEESFVVSCRVAEQFGLWSKQRIMTTTEGSVLRREMTNLESQEEDAPRRILWFKPMS
jgi:hypothetical protein